MMDDPEKFDEIMKGAANAVWDQEWGKASTLYMDAVRLNPLNTQALAGLGLSLMNSGKLQASMQTWLRLSKLIPHDPLAHEKLAELYLRSGFQREAAQRHLAAGEIYQSLGNSDKAIPHWEQAAYYDPSILQSHIRLAPIYEKNPEKIEMAVCAYLYVAFLLQKADRLQQSEQTLLHAQELSPINSDVRNALASLKEGIEISLPGSAIYPPRISPKTTDELFSGDDDQKPSYLRRNPIETAAKYAMEELAELVFIEDLSEKVQVLLLDGIEAQGLGDRASAIKAYEEIKKQRFDHDALDLLLGLMYAESGDKKKAEKFLSKCRTNPAYKMAVNIEIGKLYLEDEQYSEASSNLLNGLISADEEVNLAEVDRIGYERLLASLEEQPQDQLADISRSLAYFLSMPDWAENLRETLTGYNAREKTAYATDLLEMILEGGKPEIAELMQLIDYYINRDMITMAKEETQHAIEIIPDYLPAHTRLADILILEGRMQEAAAKINLVANTYQMRGNDDKAADLLSRVIDIWPADMSARQKVIEMLRAQHRTNEAMRHYIDMGNVFQHSLADTEKAQKVYDEALEYGRRNEVDEHLIIQVLKAMADIEVQHLRWQKAIVYYQKVLELSPADAEAANHAIDLYFQLKEPSQAIGVLDGYLRHLVNAGEMLTVLDTLRKHVKKHPTEVGLRKRLADIYVQQKKKADAIEQLNMLGEMYLEAGRMKEAKDTIRKLISLDPPDVESYKQLLKQIEMS